MSVSPDMIIAEPVCNDTLELKLIIMVLGAAGISLLSEASIMAKYADELALKIVPSISISFTELFGADTKIGCGNDSCHGFLKRAEIEYITFEGAIRWRVSDKVPESWIHFATEAKYR